MPAARDRNDEVLMQRVTGWPSLAPGLVVVCGLLLGATGDAGAQPRPVPTQRLTEDVGSWHLDCALDPMTDQGECTIRHKVWVEVPRPGPDGVPGMALEIMLRSGEYVPALTSRELTLDNAARGLMAFSATGQIRLDGNRLIELPCTIDGRALVCAPSLERMTEAAQQLRRARVALVRMRSTIPLPIGVPAEPVALDLADTQQAIARYRQMLTEARAARAAAPTSPGAASGSAPGAAPPPSAEDQPTPAQEILQDVAETLRRLMLLVDRFARERWPGGLGGGPGRPAPAPSGDPPPAAAPSTGSPGTPAAPAR